MIIFDYKGNGDLSDVRDNCGSKIMKTIGITNFDERCYILIQK